MHPAARALRACGLPDGDGQTRIVRAGGCDGSFVCRVVLGDEALGNDEQLLEIHIGYLVEHGLALAGGAQSHGGLERLADALIGACLFENAVDVVSHGDERIPPGHLGIVERVLGKGLVHLIEHDVARIVPGAMGHGEPDLIAGEGEDGREHLGQGIEDQEQSCLRAPALKAVAAGAVEPVLDDIKVEV